MQPARLSCPEVSLLFFLRLLSWRAPRPPCSWPSCSSCPCRTQRPDSGPGAVRRAREGSPAPSLPWLRSGECGWGVGRQRTEGWPKSGFRVAGGGAANHVSCLWALPGLTRPAWPPGFPRWATVSSRIPGGASAVLGGHSGALLASAPAPPPPPGNGREGVARRASAKAPWSTPPPSQPASQPFLAPSLPPDLLVRTKGPVGKSHLWGNGHGESGNLPRPGIPPNRPPGAPSTRI